MISRLNLGGAYKALTIILNLDGKCVNTEVNQNPCKRREKYKN
jgi:hypothetical protein